MYQQSLNHDTRDLLSYIVFFRHHRIPPFNSTTKNTSFDFNSIYSSVDMFFKSIISVFLCKPAFFTFGPSVIQNIVASINLFLTVAQSKLYSNFSFCVTKHVATFRLRLLHVPDGRPCGDSESTAFLAAAANCRAIASLPFR